MGEADQLDQSPSSSNSSLNSNGPPESAVPEAVRQRLDSLTMLARKLSHSFNNMLAGIVGYADLTRASIADDHPAAPFVGEIEAAAKKASDFVRQLMTFAAMYPGGSLPTDLQSVLTGAAADAVPPGWPVAVAFDWPAKLPPVIGDGNQLRRALAELVRNALDAVADLPANQANSQPEAPVKVSVRIDRIASKGMPPFAPLAQARWVLNPPIGPVVRVEITDAGPGFPADLGDRIVDPFVTTRPARIGFGLALAMGIFRAHNAGMALFSPPGGGAGVAVFLPTLLIGSTASQADASSPVSESESTSRVAPPASSSRLPAQSEPAPLEPAYQGCESIVVIEHEPSLSAMLSQELARYGYTVRVADSSTPLAAMASSASADLVIVDAASTDFNLPDLLHRLGTMPRELRVLLTAQSANSPMVAGLARVDWIHKPFSLRELVGKVRRLLDRAAQP